MEAYSLDPIAFGLQFGEHFLRAFRGKKKTAHDCLSFVLQQASFLDVRKINKIGFGFAATECTTSLSLTFHAGPTPQTERGGVSVHDRPQFFVVVGGGCARGTE